MSEEERAMLLELYGAEAVERNGVFLVNYHRVHALFPPQPPPPAHDFITMPVEDYLDKLFTEETLCS